MSVQSPAPRPSNPAAFEDLLAQALVHRTTPDFALKSGVNVYGLVRYAAGACEPGERQAVESDLGRLSWCTEVVVELVKSAREVDNHETHTLLMCARDGSLERVFSEDSLVRCLEEVCGL